MINSVLRRSSVFLVTSVFALTMLTSCGKKECKGSEVEYDNKKKECVAKKTGT